MFRSVLSVVMGFLVMALVTFAYIALLFMAFPDSFSDADESGAAGLPTVGMQVAMLFFDFVTAMFGGYFTAAVAGSSPKKHAAALAILIGVLGLTNTIATFGTEPVAYAWVRTIGAPFLVYAGGMVRSRFPDAAEAVETVTEAVSDD